MQDSCSDLQESFFGNYLHCLALQILKRVLHLGSSLYCTFNVVFWLASLCNLWTWGLYDLYGLIRNDVSWLLLSKILWSRLGSGKLCVYVFFTEYFLCFWLQQKCQFFNPLSVQYILQRIVWCMIRADIRVARILDDMNHVGCCLCLRVFGSLIDPVIDWVMKALLNTLQ